MFIQCTIWGQLIKNTKFVIASLAHTITISLSPPQRPLCIVGRLLCCGEAGEKEKESAIIDILMGIPSGNLCGGERLYLKISY